MLTLSFDDVGCVTAFVRAVFGTAASGKSERVTRILEMRGKDSLRLFRVWCLFQTGCVLFFIRSKTVVISTHSAVFQPHNFYLVLGVPGVPLLPLRAVGFQPFPPPRAPPRARLALLLPHVLRCVLTGLLQQFWGSALESRTRLHFTPSPEKAPERISTLGRWIWKAEYRALWT